MAVFWGNSLFSLKASPIAPQSVSPNHFPPPMPTNSLFRGETGTSLKTFLDTTLPFFTSNIKQILSELPRVVVLKGVGKCSCWILPKIYTFYVVLDVFLEWLTFFSEEAEVESEPGYPNDFARFSSIFVFYDIVIPLWWVSRTSLDRLRHRSS